MSDWRFKGTVLGEQQVSFLQGDHLKKDKLCETQKRNKYLCVSTLAIVLIFSDT